MATEVARSRPLGSVTGWIQKSLLISLMLVGVVYISGLHLYLKLPVFPTQYFAIGVGLAMSATFLTVPMHSKVKGLPWYDILFAILSFACGIWVCINTPKWAMVPMVVEPARWISGWIAVPLCVEATRRVIGPVMAGLALLLILYAKFGYLVPGLLSTKELSWQLLGGYLFLDPNAFYGIPVAVIATTVLGFILFGTLLMATGAGHALTTFALSAFGRFTGGPAKVAVVSSSLFGTLSGSTSANIVLTGSMTIPMMKSTGFKPHVAAAIEAVASTGGQLMPPVMGAAAFLIAEFLGIPYVKVAIAALLPALLYYATLFIQVHLQAKKQGLSGLPSEQLTPILPALVKTWVLAIPLAILIYFLFILHYNPGKSALLATAVSLIIAYISRESRLSLSAIANMLVSAGRIMADIAVMAAVAGIIVGVVQLTGSAFALTLVFASAGENMAPVLLLLAAVIAMLLGMGMTTTAIYVLMAVLVAPAVISLGINPLGAHLFVFYYALMGFLTPPVCPAAWVAAPIAGAPMMKTGWTSARLGIVGYIVPFIFVFSPALLLQGHFGLLLPTVVTALAGIAALAIGAVGYLFRPVGALRRILFILAGLALLMPIEFGQMSAISNICGGVLCVAMVLLEWLGTRQKQTP